MCALSAQDPCEVASCLATNLFCHIFIWLNGVTFILVQHTAHFISSFIEHSFLNTATYPTTCTTYQSNYMYVALVGAWIQTGYLWPPISSFLRIATKLGPQKVLIWPCTCLDSWDVYLCNITFEICLNQSSKLLHVNTTCNMLIC